MHDDPGSPAPVTPLLRNPCRLFVDVFVKSSDAALRFALRHCGVRQSTPHSSGFARLACGLFTKPSCIQGCCIFLREHHSLSALRRTWLDLNVSTLRAEIAISSPVWGFLPRRDFLSLTTKFPKPEILIFSPLARLSLMVSKTDSTIRAESFFENPSFSYTF